MNRMDVPGMCRRSTGSRSLLAIAIATSVLLPSSAHAGIVDLSGSKAAGGTYCVPQTNTACPEVGNRYPTISAAMVPAGDGDTILVGPGSYDGFNIETGVTVRSTAGAAATTIIPTSSAMGTVWSWSPRVALEGFTVDQQGDSGSGGAVNMTGTGSAIRHNVITQLGGSGILGIGIGITSNGSGITVEGNEITGFASGVYFNPTGGTGDLFKGNDVHGNSVAFNGPTGYAGGAGIAAHVFRMNRIHDNTTGFRLAAPLSGQTNGVSTFRFNCFEGNSTALSVSASNPEQDAQKNYWGAPDGPSGVGRTGSGDQVSGPVDAASPLRFCSPELVESLANPILNGTAPSVLYEDGVYRMWYSKGTSIGYAESRDAQTWNTTFADVAPTVGFSPAKYQQPTVTRLGPSTLRLWWGTGNSGNPSLFPEDQYDWEIYTALSTDDGASWGSGQEATLTALEIDRYQIHVLPKTTEEGAGYWGYVQSGGTLYRIDTLDPNAMTGWGNQQILDTVPECPYAQTSSQCVSAMVTRGSDGRYDLWYSTYQGADTGDQDAIRYAASLDGLSFYPAPDPLLHADDGVAWRGMRTTMPWAVQRGQGFDVFFGGMDAAGVSSIGVASTDPLPLTILDCGAMTDDAAGIQAIVDALPDFAELRLRGVCDVTRVPASGATETGVTNAAIVIPPDLEGVTITSDDPANPALILGSGTQAGIYVAPGNVGTTITKLVFNNLAQPIVVHNATDTTIGSDGSPLPGQLALAGNDILGGATMSAGVLGLVSRNDPSANFLVTDGAGNQHSFSGATPATLSGLKIVGNYVRFQPSGIDAVGISIYQKGPIAFASDIEIVANAVGSTTPDPASSNMVGVRVWATTDAATPAITDVRILGNNLGRFEELSDASGSYDAGDVHSAGRFGILVNRAGDVVVKDNGLRATITTTPGLTVPGGGIIFSDVETGLIDGNGIIVLSDPQTASVDLGAIGVIDNVGKLLGGGAQQGLATDSITVTDNVVGFVSTEGPIGAAKGLVVNGASNVNAFGNEFKVIRDRSIYIGAALQGFDANFAAVNEPPRPVTGSRFCANWLNTTRANAADSPTSQILFRSGIGSSGNQFPGGHLYAGNGRC